MKHPFRTIFIWLVMLITAVAAFTLAITITGDTMVWSGIDEDVVIDMEEDPYDMGTTQEPDFFWQKYLQNEEEDDLKQKSTEGSEEQSTKEEPISSDK